MTTALNKAGPATVHPAGRNLHVTVFDNVDQLEAVASEWDTFIERAGSDIYFTSTWLQVWWKYYGRGRKFHGLLFRDEETIVAVLPFAVERLGVGPLSVCLAQFVGADSTIPVLSPAVLDGHGARVAKLALYELLIRLRCDFVSFSQLSGISTFADAVRAAVAECAVSGAYKFVRDDSENAHVWFSLPEDFDAYLTSLPKQARSNYRRDRRNLAERYETVDKAVAGIAAASRFDAFVKLHNEQWNAIGKSGHFGDWPCSFEFNRSLVDRLATGDQVRFFELWGGGELLSSQFCFVFGDRCYWRLPGRCVNPALEKLGLGRVGLVSMLKSLIGEEVRHVEAGPGHYEYKLRYGGEEFTLRRLVVARNKPTSRYKAGIVLRLSELIHFLYYRVWFLKFARRLPGAHGPLWSGWIRTRF